MGNTVDLTQTRDSENDEAKQVKYSPILQIQYTDPYEGVNGYLAIDTLVNGAAAGGLRVCKGTSPAEVAALARNMTLKQSAVGIKVGGAKGGIDMDPTSPAVNDVLKRFFATLKPVIENRWSVGPDMNTNMADLERLAGEVGIPSLKIAVGRSRNLTDDEFLRRYALFNSDIKHGTVNQFRPSTAAAAAIKVLLKVLNRPGSEGHVAIQGAGTMGGGTAQFLWDAGVRIVAWADDEKCLVDESGLDVPTLLANRSNGRLPSEARNVTNSEDILSYPCDVLVIAAVSGAVGLADVPKLKCKSMAVLANMGISYEAERALHEKNILVVPDLLASAGGSLSVEALYESNPKDGQAIIDHVAKRAKDLTEEMIKISLETGELPREVLNKNIEKSFPGLSVKPPVLIPGEIRKIG